MAIINIDNVLGNIELNKIVNYPYFIGDCLFDYIKY